MSYSIMMLYASLCCYMLGSDVICFNLNVFNGYDQILMLKFDVMFDSMLMLNLDVICKILMLYAEF